MKGTEKKLTAIILTTALTLTMTLAASGSNGEAQASSYEDEYCASILSVSEIPEETVPDIKAEHDTESVLIRLHEDASLNELNRYLRFADSVKSVTVTEDDVHLNTVKLELRDNVDTGTAMAQLSSIPLISYAQPDYIYHIPEDEMVNYGSSSHPETDEGRKNTASVNDPYINDCWYLQSVSACEAWDVQKTEKKVTVAVIDGGFNINHPDLKDNIVGYYDAAGDGIEGGQGSELVINHGSHICGIIAAKANNNKGIAGVSYDAGLFPVNVAKKESKGELLESNILKGFECILKNREKYNIRAINMSLAADLNLEYKDFITKPGYYDILMNECILSAYDEGIVTIFSAGNSANIFGGPFFGNWGDAIARSIEVISLGNGTYDEHSKEVLLDEPLSRSYFSNYNMPGQTTKDISAPGWEILSSGFNDYYFYSGTSMAAPVVSGVAALVLAARPDLTVAQLTDILLSSAVDMGDPLWDEGYGFGELNAYNAVKLAKDGFEFDGGTELKKGETLTLTPSRSGNYRWETSDEAVATVDKGVIKGVGSGVVRITAFDERGFSLTRSIAVIDAEFNGPDSIRVGEKAGLSFDFEPKDGIIWTLDISDRSVLKADHTKTEIERYGEKDIIDSHYSLEISGLKPGKARVTYSYGSVSYSKDITVVPSEGEALSNIVTENEMALLNDPNVSALSKNKILSGLDTAIESRVSSTSEVVFDSAITAGGKDTSKKYRVKLSMNGALRADGRKHLYNKNKTGRSKNNDIDVKVFYSENSGEWKEARVKKAKIKNAKNASFDCFGRMSGNIKGIGNAAYLSGIVLEDRELDRTLGKALDKEIRELNKKLKNNKSSTLTDADLMKPGVGTELKLVIPVYPIFIGISGSSGNYTDGSGKENRYIIKKGSFDKNRMKLKKAGLSIKYNNGKEKELKLKYSKVKDKDFKSAVNATLSPGGKVTLEGTGNYYGYIEY